MKKVLPAILLVVVISTLIYVYSTGNFYLFKPTTSKNEYISGNNGYITEIYPVPPDFGIRIYPELKEGKHFFSFKEKSVTLNLTIVFKFVKGFNETVKIRIKEHLMTPQMFDYGWNGTNFVFGELEKQCKIRYSRPVNYEVFFDKTEFFVEPNLNTELNVILKIYETPIDPRIKYVKDLYPDSNPNLVFVNESNFGWYTFVIVFDDFGYWNKFPEKGSGLELVHSFAIDIPLGGYIVYDLFYDQIYEQNKEIIEQLRSYYNTYCG